MKESTKFFVGLTAALITFGTLTLALGPRRVGWRDHHHHHGYGVYHHAPDTCVERHHREIPPGESGDS